MPQNKKQPGKQPAKKKTEMRMVRIPEPFALALEQIAKDEYTDLTGILREAVKKYLTDLGRMPPPPSVASDA